MTLAQGSYVAACYALKYPVHAEKLVLFSPIGMGGAGEKGAETRGLGHRLMQLLWGSYQVARQP